MKDILAEEIVYSDSLIDIVDNNDPFPRIQMAAKPLTSEAIALTEKKMDMSLGMHFNCLIFILAKFHCCIP